MIANLCYPLTPISTFRLTYATASNPRIQVFKPSDVPRAAFADRSWLDPNAKGPLGQIRWNGWHKETVLVHGGGSRSAEEGQFVVVPAVTSSTIPARTCAELAARFANGIVAGRQGTIYQRLGHKTGFELECALTGLHGCGDAMVFGSGMAAISHLILTLVRVGDNIVVHRTMYGCTDDLVTKILPEIGIEARLVDLRDPRILIQAIDEKTRLVLLETPDNPTLGLVDISSVASFVGGRCPVIVDNTIASPVGQNPFDHGANLVLYSLTKSIGGHSSAVGGAILGSGKFMAHMFGMRNALGGMLAPEQAQRFLEGMKTLRVRYTAMQANAQTIAEILSNHPEVEAVFYPGLDPKYPLNGQMKGPGHMVAFVLKKGLEGGRAFVDALQLITNAVSMGGVESLTQVSQIVPLSLNS